MLRFLHQLVSEYPVVRGMLAYSALWPIGSLFQQTIVEGRNFRTYDYKKCAIYGAYGALFSGPTLYLWMRIASIMWPKRTLKASLAKAYTEQLAYDPLAIIIFMVTMSLAEGKSAYRSKEEVTEKFVETYKVGFIYWPIVQTFNFSLVVAKNQIIAASFFSLIWTSFLAYMKHIEIHHLKEKKTRAKEKGGFLSILH